MTSMIMDSPSLQSSSHPSRVRSHATITHQLRSPVDNRGAVHKRPSTNDRNRSISLSQADRLYRLAAEHSNQAESSHEESLQPSSIGVPWITPQHSPQLHNFATESSLEPFSQWTVPTPPRSDSGIPNVSVDSSDEPVTTGISSGQDFVFEQSSGSAEMSSLGFLLPSQYGAAPYEGNESSYNMEPSFPPIHMSQPTTTSGTSAYAQTAPSSTPSLYQNRTSEAPPSRRQSEMPPPPSSSGGQSYDPNYHRTSNPYESSYANNAYPAAPKQTIPSISGITQSPLPSPHIGSTSNAQGMPQQYHTSISRSPSMYESNPYGQGYTTAPAQSQMYATSQQPNMTYPPPFVGSSVNEVLAKPMGADSSIRVLNQRPKPQCWEHGCNGRQFSTFSNLLRHQREKSGTAAKSYCPKCGAEFTRTTARNGHLAHDKCTKQRRQSDGK